VCGLRRFSLFDASFEPSGERYGERVERGLPPHGPACSSAARWIKGSGDQIQAFQGSILVRKVTSGPHGPAVAGVDRFDRVRRADNPPDLDVVFQERHELRPGALPKPHDCRIPLSPLCREFSEPVFGCLLGRGGVHGFECLHDAVAVLAAGIAEAFSDQVNDALLHDRAFPCGRDRFRQGP